MKKILFIAFLCFLTTGALAQVSIRGGMGIQFASTPSFRDYLNTYSSANTVGDFSSEVIFSLEGGYRLKPTAELALEMAYLLNSYTFNFDNLQYEFSYGIVAPTVFYYYVLNGQGYNFKFGGGAGPRFVNVSVRNAGNRYSSTGFGLVLRVDGNTSLGGKFYANIGGDIRYDINGEPKNNGVVLYNDTFRENVNLNSFSVGVRLGITYQF